MRANFVRKGCQHKLMKGISSIQKSSNDILYDNFMSGGIPKQISTNKNDKRKHHILLKI